MSRAMKRYALKGPCADCPFRTSLPIPLHPSRAAEIAHSLRAGESFTCHKTVVYSDDLGDGVGEVDDRHAGARECGGAMAVLERQGIPNQGMRIAERLGLYEPEQIDADAPVFDSLDEWVEAMCGADR